MEQTFTVISEVYNASMRVLAKLVMVKRPISNVLYSSLGDTEAKGATGGGLQAEGFSCLLAWQERPLHKEGKLSKRGEQKVAGGVKPACFVGRVCMQGQLDSCASSTHVPATLMCQLNSCTSCTHVPATLMWSYQTSLPKHRRASPASVL